MKPHRISVKFFIDGPLPDLATFTPIFHRWIRENALAGLLIDVADYKHVPKGPGIVLIGHEADYAIDQAEGRPGLLCVYKHFNGEDVGGRLRRTVDAARAACKLLEQEPGLTFQVGESRLTVLDRLAAPNNDTTLDALRGEVQAAYAELAKGQPLILSRASVDDREALGIAVNYGA